MGRINFSKDELEVKDKFFYMGTDIWERQTPITPKENFEAMLHNEPHWQTSIYDYMYLFPKCVPDNPAKGNVSDEKLSTDQLGGKDMFGIEWEYEVEIGGSTVRPGAPLLEDANDWPDKVVFPTKEVIDSWDWEECKRNAEKGLREPYLWEPVICTGWFERLISFMDFAGAAVAIIDEDQQDAIKELFQRLSDLYIMLIDKYMEVFPGKIGAVCLHDDWGHQRGIFFSPDTVREMIVPYMKQVTDYCHSKGLYTECHSCGKVDTLLPCYIEAGFDMLECQPLLDFAKVVPLYGDQLKMHVTPDVPEPGASEEEYRAAARAFIDLVCSYGKPVIMEGYYANPMPPEFLEEIYHYSRIKFEDLYH